MHTFLDLASETVIWKSKLISYLYSWLTMLPPEMGIHVKCSWKERKPAWRRQERNFEVMSVLQWLLITDSLTISRDVLNDKCCVDYFIDTWENHTTRKTEQNPGLNPQIFPNFLHCIRLGNGLFGIWTHSVDSFQVFTMGITWLYQFCIRKILFFQDETYDALLSGLFTSVFVTFYTTPL